MTLPLTVSCFSKIQTGSTFLAPADLGSPGKRAVKRVCVCVLTLTFIAATSFLVSKNIIMWRVDPSIQECSHKPFHRRRAAASGGILEAHCSTARLQWCQTQALGKVMWTLSQLADVTFYFILYCCQPKVVMRPTYVSISIIKRWSVSLSCRFIAAMICGGFTAELGRRHPISINSC